jgi:hypothetical protein
MRERSDFRRREPLFVIFTGGRQVELQASALPDNVNHEKGWCGMRNRNVIVAIFLAGMSLTVGQALAVEAPSAEYGKKLFEGVELGGPGGAASCSDCHLGGKRLEKVRSNPDLARTINNCLIGPMKGNAMPADSRELQSLILYLRSLIPKNK